MIRPSCALGDDSVSPEPQVWGFSPPGLRSASSSCLRGDMALGSCAVPRPHVHGRVDVPARPIPPRRLRPSVLVLPSLPTEYVISSHIPSQTPPGIVSSGFPVLSPYAPPSPFPRSSGCSRPVAWPRTEIPDATASVAAVTGRVTTGGCLPRCRGER